MAQNPFTDAFEVAFNAATLNIGQRYPSNPDKFKRLVQETFDLVTGDFRKALQRIDSRFPDKLDLGMTQRPKMTDASDIFVVQIKMDGVMATRMTLRQNLFYDGSGQYKPFEIIANPGNAQKEIKRYEERPVEALRVMLGQFADHLVEHHSPDKGHGLLNKISQNPKDFSFSWQT